MTNRRPTVVSLFAGGGGLHLGMIRAGFQPLWANDIVESAAKTFELNQPKVGFHLGDIRHITPSDAAALSDGSPVDLVVGGPPCQGFSTLGDQLPGDPRNTMYEAYARMISWIQPRVFLMENTSYLRSQYGGTYEEEIRRVMESLGYSIDVRTLNAADFGTPQLRQRVFFVGTRDGSAFDWPEATHGPETSNPYATVGPSIMDLAELGPEDVPNHLALNHGDIVTRRYELIPEGGRLPPPSELPADLRRRNFGNTYKRLHRNKPSLTLVPGNNAFPVHPTLNRSLTPREAARLQDFPDDYVFAGNRADQCKLIGNAVPVNLAASLGTALRIHLETVTDHSETQRPVIRLQDYTPAADRGVRRGTGLSAISFFSGAGGLTLGFVRAGYDVKLSIDRKSIVDENFRRNFPEIPHMHADVSELKPEDIAQQIGQDSVDVVFGGSPCQGFSIFGQRRFVNTKGHKLDQDPRNELTIQYIDIAIGLNARAILLENVKGLLSADRGKSTYLKAIHARLKRAGYKVDHRLVNCAHLGVPQKRERVLLVAFKDGLEFDWPEQKFFESPKSWQDGYVTVWDAIADLADPSTHSQEFSHVPMKHKELLVRRYELIPEGGRLPERDLPAELSQGYRTNKVKNFSHVYRRLSRFEPATTMVPGHNAFPVHPVLPRSLTVREAARIQTFPDWMKFTGTRQQQCILVGNAVPPRLSEIFAHAIAKTLNGNASAPGYKADHYELRATQ